MISTSEMVYISIESRKGGVGKTTTALALAEVLLEEGFQVLMIDMDIVGTTIDSTFINAYNANIHEVKLSGKPVNLVRLFKELYMAGMNVPAFAMEEEKKENAFSFSFGKCNFIGSNIYEKNGVVPLEDPRILYDAYHAYWLLEFVKVISKSFADAARIDDKVAVILDNSPGFSSIENGIHDYITDLGPSMGKILLVSTIDPQDIGACRQSKSIIQSLFDEKKAAGSYYRSMIERGEGLKRKSQAFDSVWTSLCASGGHQPEYYTSEHGAEPPFVSILVNKVPQIIFEKIFSEGILNRESEEASPFQNHLLYYFSNPQLMSKEITHKQIFTGRFDQYRQSGNIVEIESDNARYMEACIFFRQLGMGDIFKEEWAPKAHFKDILKFMRGQEILREESVETIRFNEGWFANKERRLEDEVKLVERFVMDNIKGDERLQDIVPLVEDSVTSVLNDIEGKAAIDFHPEHPSLQEIGDFVTSFGLAVYRLHIYEQVCELFNRLMSDCLEDVENMEKLNKDAISRWMANVFEGRVVNQDVAGTLSQMLDDRKNARELRKSLQVIISSWQL